MLQSLASTSNLLKQALLTLTCHLPSLNLHLLFCLNLHGSHHGPPADMHSIKRGIKPHGVTHNRSEKRACSPLIVSQPSACCRLPAPRNIKASLTCYRVSALIFLQASCRSSAPPRRLARLRRTLPSSPILNPYPSFPDRINRYLMLRKGIFSIVYASEV